MTIALVVYMRPQNSSLDLFSSYLMSTTAKAIYKKYKLKYTLNSYSINDCMICKDSKLFSAIKNYLNINNKSLESFWLNLIICISGLNSFITLWQNLYIYILSGRFKLGIFEIISIVLFSSSWRNLSYFFIAIILNPIWRNDY